ncbi:MAG: orotate phosphoribosyltransferase [Nitrospinaceae bacterium]
MSISQDLAQIALETGAIQINTGKPFVWASGYSMPVYNDNRRLLGKVQHRMLVARGFQSLLQQFRIPVDVIAGTATAGIPHATTLANLLETPLIYVRSAPKKHGMQNQVEGILKKDQQAVVIEDLISTGGSALKVVEAIRLAGGKAGHCLCIFNYGFPATVEYFREAGCKLHSLLTFEELISHAEKTGSLSKNQTGILRSWYQDPFGWGGRQGLSPSPANPDGREEK